MTTAGLPGTVARPTAPVSTTVPVRANASPLTAANATTDSTARTATNRKVKNAPVFNQTDYYCTMSEDAIIGTSLLDVYATDADQGKNGAVHYELEPYGAEIIATSYLVVDSVSGRVTLLSPISRNLLSSDTLLVWVKAVDRGVPPRDTKAQLHIRVVDVNDHCPEFRSPDSESAFYVNMSTEVNTTVSVIEVTDEDFGDNGKVTCSIGVGTDNVVREIFDLDSTSGRISSSVSPLPVGSFPVVLVATDGATNACSNQLAIVIHVLPPDVHPPMTTTTAPTNVLSTTTSSSAPNNMELRTTSSSHIVESSTAATISEPHAATKSTTTPAVISTITEQTTPQRVRVDSLSSDSTRNTSIILGTVLGVVVLIGGLVVGVLVFKMVVLKAQMAKYSVGAAQPSSGPFPRQYRVSPAMDVPVE